MIEPTVLTSKMYTLEPSGREKVSTLTKNRQNTDFFMDMVSIQNQQDDYSYNDVVLYAEQQSQFDKSDADVNSNTTAEDIGEVEKAVTSQQDNSYKESDRQDKKVESGNETLAANQTGIAVKGLAGKKES